MRLLVVLAGLLCLLQVSVAIKPHQVGVSHVAEISPVGKVTIPIKYPLFKQCDPKWGNDVIVTETICAVGCLMSSLSMALNGKGVEVPLGHGKDVATDPGTLNSWLKVNGGYTSGNDLEENVTPKLNPAIAWDGPYIPANSLSGADIKTLLTNGTGVVIANVNDGTHFVLVVGFDSGDVNWYVNDPGFPRTVYTISEIVGWRIWQVQKVKHAKQTVAVEQ